MTTKTTHTLAPWQAMQFDESQTVIFPVAKGPLIAIVSVGDGRPDGPANVALFLAAPAMLAALKNASRALTALDPLARHHDATLLDNALSQAEGGTQPF